MGSLFWDGGWGTGDGGRMPIPHHWYLWAMFLPDLMEVCNIVVNLKSFDENVNCGVMIRYITSDCDAVSIIHDSQGYAKSPEDAVVDVLKAGMGPSASYLFLSVSQT